MTRGGIAARLAGAWDRFWFAPASAENLGWCRLLFFAGISYFLGTHDFARLGSADPVFWNPIWWFRILRISPEAKSPLLRRRCGITTQ